MADDAETQERLWWSVQSMRGEPQIEGYFSYLETFPLGPHNRRAAEAIERAAARLEEPARDAMLERLRAVRDPYLPELEPDTMDGT